jgi:hypothetical protein
MKREKGWVFPREYRFHLHLRVFELYVSMKKEIDFKLIFLKAAHQWPAMFAVIFFLSNSFRLGPRLFVFFNENYQKARFFLERRRSGSLENVFSIIAHNS